MELLKFFIEKRDEVLQLTIEHLLLVVVAIGAAIVIGVPVGILLTRRARLARPVLAVANVLQTIPSLALFGFLIPLLGSYGIGRVPAIIALFLYSLLPIIRNTYTGITGVDPAVREAARGMGMSDWQMLRQVELPLAMSVIIAGVRVATVIAVGTATIAAAIGAGGLGMYIFRGLRMDDNTLIFAGAVPAAIMALGADFVLGWVEKRLAPGARRKSRKVARATIIAGLLVIFIGSTFFISKGRCVSAGGCIIVGSKDFTEQVILGELIAQTIRSRAGIDVEQQFELGGNMCHRAMLAGEMDVYIEYTGTAFMSLLKREPLTDAREVFNQVKQEYAARFGFEVLPSLGFNNTFAILVRGEDARRLNLKTISDAAKYAPQWRAGFGQDFMSREDGYPGFARAYGLKFAEPPREMDLSLTYRALAGRQVDLIAGNSTDGLIDKLDLYQLEDDRHYFPPYEAVPIVRREAIERHPEIANALRSLAGKITDADMRRLNYAVDGEKRDVREVVREFLSQH
ncbi:MAG TPA: glycine betaine ABC transporter substrate-binding protein [Blastocatellia bacterium]|nr:glycine betaine ABC transporter substrate-binding protein [Blastocatellia bacterium]